MSHSSDKGGPGARRGSQGSIEADHILRKLDKKAFQSPSGGRPVPKLPSVRAPSLENLAVTVPAPEDLTEQDILLRLHEHALVEADKRERASGEPIEMGDLVLLDTLGYADGQLIPFSVRAGLELEMAPQAELPGLCEGLVGTPVGEGREVVLVLPDDYPVEALRGVEATFLVDVVAAQQVALPAPDSDEFLALFGEGMTMDELMESIAEELEDELAEELWLEARELVLDELVLRSPEVALTPELVDEEIRRSWEDSELPLLKTKDFDEDELREALDCWLSDEDTRLDAERNLRVGLALRAIVERDQLVLTPKAQEELLEAAVEPLGLSPEQAREALADPQTSGPIRDSLMHLMAVEHVMSLAEVSFEGEDEVFSGPLE